MSNTTERLRSNEQKALEQRGTISHDRRSTKSRCSGMTRASGASKTPRSSVMSKKVEAAARAARLKGEMKYFDHETHLKRIQLDKEIALADAEEVIKLVMNEVERRRRSRPHKLPCLFSRSVKEREEGANERMELVSTKGLRFGCLKEGHQSKNCRSRLNCQKCGKPHPESLHIPSLKEAFYHQKNTSEFPQSDKANGCQTTSNVVAESTSFNLNASVCSAIDYHGDATNSLIMTV